MRKVARANGLPDMPALTGLFQPFMSRFIADPLVWVKIVDVDVGRWILTIEDLLGGGMLVTPFPDDPPTVGFVIPFGQYREFKFVDYGPIVGMAWYGWNRGAAGEAACFTNQLFMKGN